MFKPGEAGALIRHMTVESYSLKPNNGFALGFIFLLSSFLIEIKIFNPDGKLSLDLYLISYSKYRLMFYMSNVDCVDLKKNTFLYSSCFT